MNSGATNFLGFICFDKVCVLLVFGGRLHLGSQGSFLLLISIHQGAFLLKEYSFAYAVPSLRSAIEAVRSRQPELPIWLGGQAFHWGGQELAEQYPLVKVFTSLAEFEIELEQVATAHPHS